MGLCQIVSGTRERLNTVSAPCAHNEYRTEREEYERDGVLYAREETYCTECGEFLYEVPLHQVFGDDGELSPRPDRRICDDYYRLVYTSRGRASLIAVVLTEARLPVPGTILKRLGVDA